MLYKKKLIKMKHTRNEKEKQEKNRAELDGNLLCKWKIGVRVVYTALLLLLKQIGKVIKYAIELSISILFNLLWLIVPVLLSTGIIILLFPDSKIVIKILLLFEQLKNMIRLLPL